jgi:hypothetical protein
MNRLLMTSTLAAGLLVAMTSFANSTSTSAATGLCKDGTTTSALTKKGACRGHQGVKEWYAAGAASTASAPAASKASAVASSANAASSAAGATGLCKDGTTTSAATKKGACRGHQGVKEWYTTNFASTAATPAAPMAPPPPAAAPIAASAAPTAPTAAPAAAAAKSAYAPPATAAPGGGTGQVWVNKSTKVYHCPGDRWYGKTKDGAYMSEADAKAQGNHADHGKACTQ